MLEVKLNPDELWQFMQEEAEKGTSFEEASQVFADLANSTMGSVQSKYYHIRKHKREEGEEVKEFKKPVSSSYKYDLDNNHIYDVISAKMAAGKSMQKSSYEYAQEFGNGATSASVMSRYQTQQKRRGGTIVKRGGLKVQKVNPSDLPPQQNENNHGLNYISYPSTPPADLFENLSALAAMSKATGLDFQPVLSSLYPLFHAAAEAQKSRKPQVDMDAYVKLEQETKKLREKLTTTEESYEMLKNKFKAFDEMFGEFGKMSAMDKALNMPKFLREVQGITDSCAKTSYVVGPGGILMTQTEIQQQQHN